MRAPWLPVAAAPRGLTLLELLVVLAILAVATAGASLALREPERSALQREAERLAALLDSGRAWSRSTGQPLQWVARPDGFQFVGRQPPDPVQRWLHPQVQVQWEPSAAVQALVLGPEPIVAAQSVTLGLGAHRLRVASDGLRPFGVTSP